MCISGLDRMLQLQVIWRHSLLAFRVSRQRPGALVACSCSYRCGDSQLAQTTVYKKSDPPTLSGATLLVPVSSEEPSPRLPVPLPESLPLCLLPSLPLPLPPVPLPVPPLESLPLPLSTIPPLPLLESLPLTPPPSTCSLLILKNFSLRQRLRCR